jgi:hypothetical protein
MAEQKKPRLCNACGSILLDGAELCKECKFWQNNRCVTCQQSLPPGAERCNGCNTYQTGLLKRIPFSQNVLALIVALVAVISPAVTALLYLFDRPSNTTIKVSGADDKGIYVKVWNTGKQPSTLLGYHLRFGGQFPIPDMELGLSNSDSQMGKNVVSSATPVTLTLVPTDQTWLPKPDHAEGYTSREFEPFKNKEITLVIDVEESRTFPKWWRFPERSDHFPIKRIRAFLCGECSDAKS